MYHPDDFLFRNEKKPSSHPWWLPLIKLWLVNSTFTYSSFKGKQVISSGHTVDSSNQSILCRIGSSIFHQWRLAVKAKDSKLKWEVASKRAKQRLKLKRCQMYKQLIPWTIHTEIYLHVTLELPRKESFCTVLKFSMASCLQENRTGRSSQPCSTIWLTHTLDQNFFRRPSFWEKLGGSLNGISNSGYWFSNLKPFKPINMLSKGTKASL